MENSDWKERTLGECATFHSGGTPSKSNPEYWKGTIPWVSAKDMKSFRLFDIEDRVTKEAVENGSRLVPKNTILLLVRGMTLHNDVPICLTTCDTAFNQDVRALRAVDGVDSLFLAYSLLARKPALLASVDSAGHGTGRLNTDTLKATKLAVPGIDEQRAVAHILGTLDDKIELNRRMNATLEAMARALFQSWFVDFDPVRAKAAGQTPAGMDPATAALFPAAFEESVLGSIPQNWKCETLGSLARNASVTFDFKRSSRVVFINTGDVLEGDFLHADLSDARTLPGQAKKAIEGDDILFTEIRPANKRFAYVDFDVSNHVVSTKFMVIRSNQRIHPRLLYRILTRAETLAEFQVIAESRSGTFPQITFDAVLHLPIVLPPIEVQMAFQSIVGHLDALVSSNKRESANLSTLRDALLPKLLSGELKVSVGEKMMEAVQ